MGEKVDVLGLDIENMSVNEALPEISRMLNNDSIYVIDMIGTELLLKAGEDEELKKCLQSMDMLWPREKAILTAAGIEDNRRMEEIEMNRFVRVCLEQAAFQEKTVFLLTDTVEDRNEFRAYLNEYYKDLRIEGDYVVENCWGDEDIIVNAINIASPNLILSSMSNPYQEQFIYAHKQKLNANAWLGLGGNMRPQHTHKVKGNFWRKLFAKRILKKEVSKYEADKK